MMAEVIFINLLNRIYANLGNPVLISQQELDQWPPIVITALKKQKLLQKATPATTVICPGCEHACYRPVHSISFSKKNTRSFVVCEQRNDVSRVEIEPEQFTQWQLTIRYLTKFIAAELKLFPNTHIQNQEAEFAIGIDKQSQQTYSLRLTETLMLMVDSYPLQLAAVVSFSNDRYTLSQKAIQTSVEHAILKQQGSTKTHTQRTAKKLGTQAMYKAWQKAHQTSKKKHPDKSTSWHSKKIAQMEVAKDRSSETIRKQLKSS